ncbi:hypothetical protein BJ912DRAFT_250563 [Pholiota molesta]|nr:hypothetical protein BJ912DRAFT_250563 [Pholiota molesta]
MTPTRPTTHHPTTNPVHHHHSPPTCTYPIPSIDPLTISAHVSISMAPALFPFSFPLSISFSLFPRHPFHILHPPMISYQLPFIALLYLFFLLLLSFLDYRLVVLF